MTCCPLYLLIHAVLSSCVLVLFLISDMYFLDFVAKSVIHHWFIQSHPMLKVYSSKDHWFASIAKSESLYSLFGACYSHSCLQREHHGNSKAKPAQSHSLVSFPLHRQAIKHKIPLQMNVIGHNYAGYVHFNNSTFIFYYYNQHKYYTHQQGAIQRNHLHLRGCREFRELR